MLRMCASNHLLIFISKPSSRSWQGPVWESQWINNDFLDCWGLRNRVRGLYILKHDDISNQYTNYWTSYWMRQSCVFSLLALWRGLWQRESLCSEAGRIWDSRPWSNRLCSSGGSAIDLDDVIYLGALLKTQISGVAFLEIPSEASGGVHWSVLFLTQVLLMLIRDFRELLCSCHSWSIVPRLASCGSTWEFVRNADSRAFPWIY